jgi:hypothetical protein
LQSYLYQHQQWSRDEKLNCRQINFSTSANFVLLQTTKTPSKWFYQLSPMGTPFLEK